MTSTPSLARHSSNILAPVIRFDMGGSCNNEKGHRSGCFPRPRWPAISGLAAHSGGARYDDPDNNPYEYYRQNSGVSLDESPASTEAVLNGCHASNLA